MATKRRSIPVAGACPAKWTQTDRISGGKPTITVGTSRSFPEEPLGSQVTVSESHPGWNRRSPGSNDGDIGGPFSTTKRTCVVVNGNPQHAVGRALVGGYLDRTVEYDGFCLPFAIAPPWPPFASSGESSLDAFGTKAIANCKPTNALVDLATTLVELIENRPKELLLSKAAFWKREAERARKAGKDYLNVEFGWRPLINDIYSTVDAVQRGDAVIKQYIRDAGRPVRRRYDFPTQHTSSYSVSHSGVTAFAAYSGGVLSSSPQNAGNVIRTRETSIKRWFSGAFTYHLPYNVAGEVDITPASEIYGLDITPETLWNIAPWSWAIDWFAPVGDLIGNLQDWASDGLVLKYGYIMEHSVVRDTYTWQGPTGLHPSLVPSPVVMTSEVKQRRPATPFGFGITWSGFTARQNAIIAALGLSKSRR
jgi:hypothetical protein